MVLSQSLGDLWYYILRRFLLHFAAIITFSGVTVAKAHANNSHQIYASSSLLKRSQTPTQPLEKHSTQDKALWDRCHVLKTRDLFVIENDLRIT